MKLKVFNEDFIVKERSNVNIEKSGRYLYIEVVKKGRNTLDVVKELSKQLGIREKDVGFAGNKDKHAVTSQVMSLLCGKDRLSKVEVDGVEIRFLGYGSAPVSLGDLEGNDFEIVVREVPERKLEKIGFVENYFDEQRFSKNNVEVGRALIKKEFSKACYILDLEVAGNDYVGALRKIPVRMLRFYVNAYQSYLWNECVARYLNSFDVIKKAKYSLGEFVFVKERENLEISLIGFSKIKNKDDVQGIIDLVMQEESISHSDFIIKQIPEISAEGEMREVFVDVLGMEIGEFVKDSIKVKFSLGKGSYATIVIKRLFA